LRFRAPHAAFFKTLSCDRDGQPTMIISKVILKNWKNFREIDTIMQDRVFVIGPNASGKSNFLDAFRFLRDISKPGGGLQKAVSDRGGISKIRCLAARTNPVVEVDIVLSEFNSKKPLWRYSIGITQETKNGRPPLLSHERVWHKGTPITDRPDKDDLLDTERLTQTHLEQINSNKEFRDISKFFESIHYLHLVPQLLKHPEAFTGTDIPGDPFGKGFLDRLSKCNSRTRKSRLKKIGRALQIAVPQLSELQFSAENGKPHIEAMYEHWRPHASRQREEQFSDGTLRLIGLLWSLFEGEGTLLLEEPELSLHSAIITQIPEIAYKIQQQKKRQVIMTTHSSDLLNNKGIGLDEILLLMPAVEGTKLAPASSFFEMKNLIKNGSLPGDVVTPKTQPQNIDQLSLNF